MFAGDIYDRKSIRLVEAPLPEPADQAGADMILLEPELACLCGSDLLYYEADYPEYSPGVGQSLHEMIGRVIETTGDKFRPGDRVLAVPNRHYGFYSRYWVTQNQAIPVDDRCSDTGAVLAQPLGTVLFALRRIPSVYNKRVMLFGAGPMGQLIVRTLQLYGAREIVVVDLQKYRLDMALEGGATEVIHGEAVQALSHAEAMPGGGPDLVIEAVGHREQVLNTCIAACRSHGEILFFGVPPKDMGDVNFHSLFWKNLRVYTSVGPSFDIDFPMAMKMIAEGTIDVSQLVSHRMPIEDIQKGFELFADRQDGAIKVFLDFPEFTG